MPSAAQGSVPGEEGRAGLRDAWSLQQVNGVPRNLAGDKILLLLHMCALMFALVWICVPVCACVCWPKVDIKCLPPLLSFLNIGAESLSGT